jgi:hypothetical protein
LIAKGGGGVLLRTPSTTGLIGEEQEKEMKKAAKRQQALRYAIRELGLVATGSGMVEAAAALAAYLEVPVPVSRELKWHMLYDFYAADPKHAARVKQPKPKPPVQAPRPVVIVLKQKVVEFAVSNEFLGSFEWRRLRIEVIAERGNRCECCGASPSDGHTVINVDHVKPRRKYPELALVKSNLQILCSACNHGKGNLEHDWRVKA